MSTVVPVRSPSVPGPSPRSRAQRSGSGVVSAPELVKYLYARSHRAGIRPKCCGSSVSDLCHGLCCREFYEPRFTDEVWTTSLGWTVPRVSSGCLVGQGFRPSVGVGEWGRSGLRMTVCDLNIHECLLWTV